MFSFLFRSTAATVATLLVGALLLIGCTWFSYSVLYPMRLQGEREANQNSQQYVESQQTFLFQKYQAICTLWTEVELYQETNPELAQGKVSQIAAFTREIEQRAAMIDESEVPEPVERYLENTRDGLGKEDCQ